MVKGDSARLGAEPLFNSDEDASLAAETAATDGGLWDSTKAKGSNVRSTNIPYQNAVSRQPIVSKKI